MEQLKYMCSETMILLNVQIFVRNIKSTIGIVYYFEALINSIFSLELFKLFQR